MAGKAYVDGKLACEATLTCAIVTRERETRAHGDQPAEMPAAASPAVPEAETA
jgi:hypothetical protein